MSFRRFVFVLGATLCAAGSAARLEAQEKKSDFAAHPFFKLLIGEWNSEGTLKGADGKEVKIEEEWTGKATTEGEFVMEGRRSIDQERQTYVWTFTHDPATGLHTATHRVTSQDNDVKRFEVSISEVDLTMELRMIGDGDSSITLKDAFADKEHEKLGSEVTLTGTGGEVHLSGKITHTRVKKP